MHLKGAAGSGVDRYVVGSAACLMLHCSLSSWSPRMTSKTKLRGDTQWASGTGSVSCSWHGYDGSRPVNHTPTLSIYIKRTYGGARKCLLAACGASKRIGNDEDVGCCRNTRLLEKLLARPQRRCIFSCSNQTRCWNC